MALIDNHAAQLSVESSESFESKDEKILAEPRPARLRRAAPLGLVDTRSLGIQLPPGTQVKQLGKALSVLQALDLVEREILMLLEKPLAFYDLITAAEARSLKSESAYAAVISLIQRRLIFLEPGR